ncbi:hypothetical protein DERP_013980, partial [Dermatophagoides pteronyssinus]
ILNMASIKILIMVLAIFVANTNVLAKKPNPLPTIPPNSSILNRVRPKLPVSTTPKLVLPTRLPTTSYVPVVSTSELPDLSVSESKSAPSISIQSPPLPSSDQTKLVLTEDKSIILDRFMGPYKGRRNIRIIYDQDFQYRCLDAMNRKRLWHENTPPLVLGDNFTQYTLDRAWSILGDIAEGKRDIVKGHYPFGESFFWYYDPNRYRSIEEAINTWYEEERHYDYDDPRFSARTGGFTQLVWRGSREATCVKIEFETPQNYKTLVVANFWPAGNVKGEFPSNVMPVRRKRPDMIEPPSNKVQRPWPRPPYRPTTEPPSYPTHPLFNHDIHEIPQSVIKNQHVEQDSHKIVEETLKNI